MADNKKPADEYPSFKKTEFGDLATLHTRRGRGLVDDDIMPYMIPKRGETMHQRDEPDELEGYKKGGRVGKPLFAGGGGGANYGKDYTKRK